MVIKRIFLVGLLASISAVTGLSGRVSAEEISLECKEIEGEFYTVLPQEGVDIGLLNFQMVDAPEESCQEATERLNEVIRRSRSRPLSSLLLRTGISRSQDVICAVFRTNSGCSSTNVVINVPEGEAPAAFLEALLAIDVDVFTLGDPDQHTRRRTYAEFGQGIQSKLK